MKKQAKVFIGLIIAGLGFIYALNTLGITDINIFFNGWWTLFIIVPCTVSLFTGSDKTGSIFGIFLGVALLLSVRGIIEFKIIFKLMLPALIIAIGLRVAFGDLFNKASREISDKIKENERSLKKYTAVFSSNCVNLSGQSFDGAVLSCAMGSIALDISESVISDDCVIRVNSVLGSAEIKVPEGVNVKMTSNTVFGDTKNYKNSQYQDAPTVYVKCVCVFGGIELR